MSPLARAGEAVDLLVPDRTGPERRRQAGKDGWMLFGPSRSPVRPPGADTNVTSAWEKPTAASLATCLNEETDPCTYSSIVPMAYGRLGSARGSGP
jgi:hypothetical protein